MVFLITTDNSADVKIITDKLDRLPLALTQAGAYLRETNISVSSYIKHYDTTWKDLMEEQGRYLLQEYGDRSVLTTWMVSYEQVASESAEAPNLLKLWGSLHREDLWYGLLASVQDFEEEVGVPEWLFMLAESEIKFNQAIGLLRRFSLVETVERRSRTHGIHTGLHAWCRYLLTDDEQKRMLLLVIRVVAQAVPAESGAASREIQERLLPHGLHVSRKISDLLARHGWTNFPEDDILTWECRQLASLLAAHTKFAEAEAMYKQALAGYEKVLGPEHMCTLGTINNLGALYYDQGKLEEAGKTYRRALAGYERTLGLEHTDTLNTVNNLGNLYCAQCKLIEAEAMYQQALAGREKVLGAKHTDTLDTVNNLGALYYDQGELVQAETMYKRALTGYERTLGSEHTSTFFTVNNLGLLFKRQGKLAEAESTYRRALAGKEKTLGAEHTSTLRTIKNLANLYEAQGKLADAEATYGRALRGSEKAVGPEHEDTLDTVNDLGALYCKRHCIQLSSINEFKVQSASDVAKDCTSSEFIVSNCSLWTKWHQARTRLSNQLGHMLLSVGNLHNAVIAFEQQIGRSHGSDFHSGVVCDGCGNSFQLPGTRYVCVSCDDTDLCLSCHRDYELGGRLDSKSSTCQNHAFLSVPRDIWSSLPSGAVLADGTTAEEWMDRLLVSLTTRNDQTVCNEFVRSVGIQSANLGYHVQHSESRF